jgi:hypothetical protein
MRQLNVERVGVHKALFWDYKDFQDRTVLIWEKLAAVRST